MAPVCAASLTANGRPTRRKASANAGTATAYPTRSPAKPHALEKVRSTTTFACSLHRASPSLLDEASTYSTYASSITTSVSDGRHRSISRSRATGTGMPVGLFGAHTMIALVRGPTAATIALRSWSSASSSGMATGTAPTRVAMTG